MDAYQRFPNKCKTLGVRWPNRHGVTAPLGKSLTEQFSPFTPRSIAIKHSASSTVPTRYENGLLTLWLR